MKEMVSWRGVAKKRRKQETAGLINQMPAHCCGHATIVARRQPLFGFIEAAPLRKASISRARTPSITTLGRSMEKFRQREIRRASSRDQIAFGNRPRIAENHKAQFARHPLQQLIVQSPRARYAC